MWDRYDPRDDDRDRGSWDRSLGGCGSTSDRSRNNARDPRDVFTRDLDLPRGPERRPVRERDRVYEIDGTESRMLGTIGSFRVVSESALHDLRDDSNNPRRSIRHLEDEGLIRTSPLSSDDRAVFLTEPGRDLLEANRYELHDGSREPRQTFYSGLRKPRELTHDTIGCTVGDREDSTTNYAVQVERFDSHRSLNRCEKPSGSAPRSPMSVSGPHQRF